MCIKCTFLRIFISSQDFFKSLDSHAEKGGAPERIQLGAGKDRENKIITVCHVIIKK